MSTNVSTAWQCWLLRCMDERFTKWIRHNSNYLGLNHQRMAQFPRNYKKNEKYLQTYIIRNPYTYLFYLIFILKNSKIIFSCLNLAIFWMKFSKINHCVCGDRRAWCMVVSGQQVIWAAGVYQQQQGSPPENPQHSPNSVGIQQNTVLQCKWAVSWVVIYPFYFDEFFHQDFKIIKNYIQD